jgi:TonB family protein
MLAQRHALLARRDNDGVKHGSTLMCPMASRLDPILSMNTSRFLPAVAVACVMLLAFAGCASGPTEEPLDKQPVAISRPPPQYPFELKQAGITGTVIVEFTIEKDGSVSHILIVRSPNPLFSAAVVAAVSKWKFEPGIRHGEPATALRQVPIDFFLGPELPAK